MLNSIPNALTIFRGVATLLIVILFYSTFPERYIIAYSLFVLAALSDYFDGYLARRWKVISDFGVVCDPLFDKILVLTLIILLYASNIVAPFILLILFVRDITTDALKNYLLAQGILTPAIYSAKIKTAAQFLMLNFMLLALAFPFIPYMNTAATVFGVIAVIFSLWSAVFYVKRFIALTKKKTASSTQ
ncbi:CDP-diacylglycerol--glycerol-3-phosphate 3-phosphatidyltransferase [Candidatus Kaiserbacteria bacterium RIFCSPLOWO2_12_FULL_53_8]|uniref:CDP-diacylglycerol--glycerol-3-phosphate 3-phosphatidyltransferase n=2 Tax=Candidatus Kaiseribacteriota TaxID=1752734 RepID=A0A1F6CWK8_9BACT|nr:MAG: CDP-diacylglycerol--glycerol-3-phosphate 3-phosphatidyltransferase [Candidatus Kaiserbacteria bacterium RIFCSPHIGHO2_01_FULL_53_29]OGG92300.1 MAG: CDP-diacylglycerol--glycerol-3-phosphate 3-phosphatidyltransferase [Candidatus Kaiserbacteria bacterium RIFCSPLOWO2_12_FULL_53_8]